jgi:hypothetical protein
MSIREFGKKPLVSSPLPPARKVSGIREVQAKVVRKPAAVAKTVPAPAPKQEPKKVEQATDLIQAVTQSLTLLAKGVEGLSEQNKQMVLQIVAENEKNNSNLQEIISRLTQPSKPKVTRFRVTHRDDDGNIAGFVAEEVEGSETQDV